MSDPSIPPLTVNGVTVDFAGGRLRDATGAEIDLRAQSLAVLRRLAQSPGVVVSKDDLVEAVWGGVAVTDDSLVQCIGDIRRALRDEAKAVLKTVPKRGYVLELPATPAAATAATAAARKPRGALLAIPLAALLAFPAVYFWRAPAAVSTGMPVIAVLPFDDMSAEGDLGYMGDGVAEDIITMLARSPDVMVIARNSSFVHGGAPVDVREVGAALGANYVLEGSVRREGDALRITAQLNDAATGRHVWAERFDESGGDPPALQDDVTGRIIASLTGEDGEIKRADYRRAWGRDSATLGEYDYFLRGLAILVVVDDKEKIDRVKGIWREGLAAHPDSALLKVKLGFAHWMAGWNFWSDDIAGDFDAARRLAQEVRARDDLTPEVRRLALWLNAYLLMIDGEFEASVAEARRAIAMAPYDSRILAMLSEVLAISGQYDEALDWLDDAAARDPAETETYHGQRGFYYRLMGRYEESIAEYRARASLQFYDHLSLAINHVRLGQMDDAKALVREALAIDPTFTRTMWREGTVYSDPAILEGELVDLAAAGLPE